MKEEIKAENAPKAIGPYSQAIKYGNIVFVSGQTGIDSKTNDMATDEQLIIAQTEGSISNLEKVLQAAGMELDNVVKTLIFIKDINNFEIVNNIYSQHFNKAYPARSCVEVSSLPANALVEIEAIAIKN